MTPHASKRAAPQGRPSCWRWAWWPPARCWPPAAPRPPRRPPRVPPGGKLSANNAAYIAADLKAPAGSLTAAGSTFVQPFFTKAFYTYTGLNQGLQVNYSGVGSGTGITDFQAGIGRLRRLRRAHVGLRPGQDAGLLGPGRPDPRHPRRRHPLLQPARA